MRQIDPRLVSETAKGLNDSPGFKQLLTVLKERAIRDWANTGSSETTRREELYRDIQALGRIENHIAEVVNSAVMDERKESRSKK